jgi:hypothetical protein
MAENNQLSKRLENHTTHHFARPFDAYGRAGLKGRQRTAAALARFHERLAPVLLPVSIWNASNGYVHKWFDAHP